MLSDDIGNCQLKIFVSWCPIHHNNIIKVTTKCGTLISNSWSAPVLFNHLFMQKKNPLRRHQIQISEKQFNHLMWKKDKNVISLEKSVNSFSPEQKTRKTMFHWFLCHWCWHILIHAEFFSKQVQWLTLNTCYLLQNSSTLYFQAKSQTINQLGHP